MRTLSAALVGSAILCATGGAVEAQDVEKGKTIFNQCSACHQLDNNMVGPKLKGVVGRKAGSVGGFSYSPLMMAAGEAGLTWSDATLADYLNNPTEYLKTYLKDKGKEASGQSKMLFKISNEQKRKDVTAYLATEK